MINLLTTGFMLLGRAVKRTGTCSQEPLEPTLPIPTSKPRNIDDPCRDLSLRMTDADQDILVEFLLDWLASNGHCGEHDGDHFDDLCSRFARSSNVAPERLSEVPFFRALSRAGVRGRWRHIPASDPRRAQMIARGIKNPREKVFNLPARDRDYVHGKVEIEADTVGRLARAA
jgi:hypothetical protein